MSLQTDIFNLGATIYWALTGQTIPTLYNVSRNGQQSFLVQSLIPTPEQHNPRVPPSLSKLVMDCVSAREAGRPADMAAVLKRLELVRYANVHNQLPLIDEELKFIAKHPDIARKIFTMSP